MAEVAAVAPAQTKRIWLKVSLTGFVIAMIGLIATALITDRTHFAWLVGWAFLPAVTGGVLVGGAIMLVGSLLLPQRGTWRGITLIAWSLIAVASPWAGWLFLIPWALLAIASPLVIWIYRSLFRS
jgi:MFS family permease